MDKLNEIIATLEKWTNKQNYRLEFKQGNFYQPHRYQPLLADFEGIHTVHNMYVPVQIYAE